MSSHGSLRLQFGNQYLEPLEILENLRNLEILENLTAFPRSMWYLVAQLGCLARANICRAPNLCHFSEHFTSNLPTLIRCACMDPILQMKKPSQLIC